MTPIDQNLIPPTPLIAWDSLADAWQGNVTLTPIIIALTFEFTGLGGFSRMSGGMRG